MPHVKDWQLQANVEGASIDLLSVLITDNTRCPISRQRSKVSLTKLELYLIIPLVMITEYLNRLN